MSVLRLLVLSRTNKGRSADCATEAGSVQEATESGPPLHKYVTAAWADAEIVAAEALTLKGDILADKARGAHPNEGEKSRLRFDGLATVRICRVTYEPPMRGGTRRMDAKSGETSVLLPKTATHEKSFRWQFANRRQRQFRNDICLPGGAART